MEDWIEVEIDEIEKVRKAKIRGVEVELFVSPYDVPEAVRGHYNEDKNKFIIEFKYVGDESTEAVEYEHVTYTVGETSSRLYGLEIDVRSLRVATVGVSVELHGRVGQELAAQIRDKATGAIDYLINRHPITNARAREDNYKLVRDAIISTQNQLFSAAA